MYCGYIVTVAGIRKHSNADRLQCVTVFGNNVIVDMETKDGDQMVFFPTDGQISKDFAVFANLLRRKDEYGNNIGGYLDPIRRNIGAMTLRGERSEGLLLPIRALTAFSGVENFKDGDQITVLNGKEICKKYIPASRPVQSSSSKTKYQKKSRTSVKFPFFAEHKDTSQLAYNRAAFKEGDICYISLKIHGTSARVSNALEVTTKKIPRVLKLAGLKDRTKKKYKIVSGTRRVVLNSFDGGYYQSNNFRYKYHEMMKDKLPKGFTVYFEIVGYTDGEATIMASAENSKTQDKQFIKQYGKKTVFSYGCNVGENDCYVYRMTMTNEDGVVVELPTEEVLIWCERLGLKHVPIFEKFIFTTYEDLTERVDKYVDGTDPIGKTHIREGVVVRIDNRDSFTAYKHKNFYFKVLENIVKVNATEPDMEEAQEAENG